MSGKIKNARARVTEDKYDVDAWAQLVKEVQNRPGNNIQELRALYEEILGIFPTAAHFWKAYAEAELAADNVAGVKSVFSRCLKAFCPSVELWRCYLQFMKKTFDGRGGGGDAVQIQKAFEYTLEQIGCDISAGVIWQEYIAFLKSPKPGSAAYVALFGGTSGQEESSRTVALRRAYQRALIVPSHSIDNLWRSYQAFEREVGKHLAAPMLAEYQGKYQAARTVYQTRKRLLEGVKWTMLALPLECRSVEMEEQSAIWQKYVAYEASNPQQLDMKGAQARVTLAHDQALMFVYHYPEFWYEAASWHISHPLGGGSAPAVAILERGAQALPGCSGLRYAAADIEESAGQAARDASEEVEASQHLAAAEAVYKGLVGEGPEDGPVKAEEDPEARALAWILYMRFARRALGVKESREVFIRAKKTWAECPWQVYVASAMMEWERGREEKVARNIFEAGLKPGKFMSNPQYVEAYCDFLLGVGDVTNARTLYERALQDSTEPETSKPLWDGFLKFEYRVGSMDAYKAVERRRQEALGDTISASDGLKLLELRYHLYGLWPTAGIVKEYMEHKLEDRPWGRPPLPRDPSEQQAPPAKQDKSRVNGAEPSGGRGGGAGSASGGRDAERKGMPPRGGADRDGPGGGRDRGGSEQRSAGPPGGAGQPPRPSPMPALPGPNEPLKQLPAALGLFITSLPQQAVEGKVPPVDLVIDVILNTDLDSMMAADTELQGGPNARPADGAPPPQSSSGPAEPYGGSGGGRGGSAQYFDGGPRGGGRGGGRDNKRPRPDGGQYGDRPSGMPDNRPPAFDIYRQRRRQKMATDVGGRG
mmetsp:Transcript_19714/g.54740  ORF Transcript_19714/g.54740 Transcript_19714/m.54740 type:complete len:821 (-) Transcript_19714:318-2780(-)